MIALVGLPARGKSFVARKLLHYLNWTGVHCKIFNVGKYRREAHAHHMATAENKSPSVRERKGACDAQFFDPKNAKAAELRKLSATAALNDMLGWLDEEPEVDSSDDETSVAKMDVNIRERVAIFDATNSTKERRQWILDRCTSPDRRHTGVVFVESICDDRELLEENYRYKISSSPDFEDVPKEDALLDLRKRVEKYESQYETIMEDSLSYIKIFNLSTKLMVNHIYGRMAKEVVPALMAWHIGTRPIYLCRPGQTISGILTDGEDYVNRAKVKRDLRTGLFEDMSRGTKKKSLRGDKLGPNGQKFKDDLLEFISTECLDFSNKRASVHDMGHTGTSGLSRSSSYSDWDAIPDQDNPTMVNGTVPLHIYTSTMPRAADTVHWEQIQVNQRSNLNPLDKGDFAGMDWDEIKRANPEWYDRMIHDTYNTRFPGGESYRDLMSRLTSVVIDVEQQVIPTLVVSHVSILQCLMAYFRNTRVERCMSIEVPLHTVIKFTPVRVSRVITPQLLW